MLVTLVVMQLVVLVAVVLVGEGKVSKGWLVSNTFHNSSGEKAEYRRNPVLLTAQRRQRALLGVSRFTTRPSCLC